MNAPYKISDVVEMTGASKEAVRFYVNEGLLPKPRKTSKNMAWYSSEHVERIQLIRELQEKQFLPLKAIKSLLHDTDDYDFTPQQRQAFATMRAQLGRTHENAGDYRHPLTATLKSYQVTETEYQELLEAGLLDAYETDGDIEIDETGQRILQLWARLRDAGLNTKRGFSPKDIEMLQGVVELLFDQEVRMFSEHFATPTDSEAVSMVERVVPLLNEALVLLHDRRIRQFLDQVGNPDLSEITTPETHQSD